jgi:two-component system, LytTR family, response regulator
MTALIIDDEPFARSTLTALIQNYCPTINIIGEADSGKTGIEAIEHYKPELVFLDVELTDMLSFDMLDKVGFPNIPFDIIFSSAFHHYAVPAFRYSAVDFLPKPVQQQTLISAVMRAQARLHEKQKLAFQVLNEHVKKQSQSRMVIRTTTDIFIVQIEEVLRMHTVKGKAETDIVLTNNKKYNVPVNLGQYEHLNPFIRVHNSTIINPNHIMRIDKKSAKWQLEMSDGFIADVATGKKDKLIEWLEQIK